MVVILMMTTLFSCKGNSEEIVKSKGINPGRSSRLANWLAKKHELIEHDSAAYDLVMSGWFEPKESAEIRARHPSVKLLAGLSLNWISSDPDWQTFLVTVANNGDPHGPLQITEDMYLKIDEYSDGVVDSRCSFPGWDDPEIYAMDPRHFGWQELILSYYKITANQVQHDGVIIDMLDAYPFCDGAMSGGVSTPINASEWTFGQERLLSLVRDNVPEEKWIIANAGCGFSVDSPFPQYLNGYILENSLGKLCGLDLERMLAYGQNALETTKSPHIVVYAVDTDDTGVIDWERFRTGFAASLLLDNTYFAFDSGPRDHGGVIGYWFEEYYNIDLGEPNGPYYPIYRGYQRDFINGTIVIAGDASAALSLSSTHLDISTGEIRENFTVPKNDAGIFIKEKTH
jgi:hypothetical protein